MRTELCELFGIDVPIFAFTHCRDVVVAVSNAGGMGVLGAVGFSPEQLETDDGTIPQPHCGDDDSEDQSGDDRDIEIPTFETLRERQNRHSFCLWTCELTNCPCHGEGQCVRPGGHGCVLGPTGIVQSLQRHLCARGRDIVNWRTGEANTTFIGVQTAMHMVIRDLQDITHIHPNEIAREAKRRRRSVADSSLSLQLAYEQGAEEARAHLASASAREGHSPSMRDHADDTLHPPQQG